MAHKTYLVSILKSIFYGKNAQNHAEKPACIFMSVCDQDILNPAMPVQALQEI